jgi:predicted metal-dependent phosphoesterase TrpH
MLTFMRNKWVGVERWDEETLWVYGVLDDDIYGVELETSIRLPDMVIQSIQGRFKRWTTPECPKAIPVLREAVGFHLLEEGFDQKVQKNIGRKGCRHFANLLVECCATAQGAATMIRGEKRKKVGEEKSFVKEGKSVRRQTREAGEGIEDHVESGGGMVIDLHLHTFPASPCSVARVDDVIEEAKKIGLDGICLTDHNYIWDKARVATLSEKHDFLILRGNEITTDQGDMLVFGLETPIHGIIKLEELKGMVSEAEGFIIAAHPFRGFLLFGSGKLGLTPQSAMKRPLFRWVDGIEVLNSKVTEKENRIAREVAEELGLLGTGGSDAHQVSEIGLCATRFGAKINDERDLVEALKGGKCSPVAFRRSS